MIPGSISVGFLHGEFAKAADKDSMARFKGHFHDLQKGVNEKGSFLSGKVKPFLNGARQMGFGEGHNEGLGQSG